METKPIAFIVACKQFFGFLPGQTLTDFKEEVQRLTPADRQELAAMLTKALNRAVNA